MADPVAAAIEHLMALDPDARDKAFRKMKMRLASSGAEIAELKTDMVQTLGAYLDKEIPEPPILVGPGVLVRGAMTVTAGRAGKGKTWLNMNRLFRWAAGLPWFDTLPTPELYPVEGPLRIVVIENEGAAGMLHVNLTAMVAGSNMTEPEKELALENMMLWGDGGYSSLKLDTPGHPEWIIREAIEKHEPDVLFMEPFRNLTTVNENDSQEMAKVLQTAEGMATEYNIAVLLAHHETKAQDDGGEQMNRLRGSGAFEGSASVIEHHTAVTGNKYRELSWSKSRYKMAPAPVRMKWNNDRFWYEHVAETEIERTVLTTLTNSTDAMTVSELADETGETQRKLRDVIKNLLDSEQITRARGGAPGQTGSAFRIKNTDDTGGLGV